MRSCLPAATGFGFVEKEEGRGKLAVFKLLPALLVWFFFAVLVLLEMEKDQRKGVVVFHKSPSNYYSLRQKK